MVGWTRRVLVLLSLVVLVFGAPDASGDTPTVIEPGSGWYCFKIHAKFNPTDRSASCNRSLETCAQLRERMRDDDSLEPSVVSDCLHQKKAAVFTYFDAMEDTLAFWALPSTELCQAARRDLLRNPDKQRISTCQLVGDVPYPPGRFLAERVPGGTGWFCSSGGQRIRMCARARVSCEAMVQARCAPQSKAVAVTWSPSPVLDAALTNAMGVDWRGIAVLKSSTDCARFRGLFGAQGSGLSACTMVGAVDRPVVERTPLDRAQVAAGSAWTCTVARTVLSRGPDTCFRSPNSCREVHGEDACQPSPTAFVLTVGTTYYAFAVRDQCEAYASRSFEASRCEVVGSLGPSTDTESPVPANLDRAMIRDAVDQVKPAIVNCGARFDGHGQVKVSVRVAPDGHVDEVVLKASPDEQLGACVVAAMRGASFSATRNGGSFGYPFVF